MGKGDKRSRRGKIFAGSYGNTRQKPHKTAFVAVERAAPEPIEKEKPKPKVRKKAAAIETTETEAPVEAPVETTTDEPTESVAEAQDEKPDEV
ncbi:MAG: 30S ribosomal protein THX [Pyrinomonadaceae bacterium]